MAFNSPLRAVSEQRSRGFTLVELLVVIAIIGVLVALLLPAIQAAREAARRSQCQNNIRNLALGVLNYESSRKDLPPSNQMARQAGGRSGPTRVLVENSGPQHSFLVQILPFIEQQPLYDQFDLSISAFNQDVNLLPHENQPGIFLCPSDDAQGLFYLSAANSSNRRFAKGNYAAYACPEHVTTSVIWPGALIHEPQPMARVTDGTSTTIMLAEVLTREEETDNRGAWALARVGSTILGADMHGNLSSNVNAAQLFAQPNLDAPLYEPGPQYAQGSLPPNTPPGAENTDDLLECVDSADADLQNMPCDNTGSNTAASRSNHIDGVNITRVDASVDFINDDIDPLVFGLIISINDGLAIPEF